MTVLNCLGQLVMVACLPGAVAAAGVPAASPVTPADTHPAAAVAHGGLRDSSRVRVQGHRGRCHHAQCRGARGSNRPARRGGRSSGGEGLRSAERPALPNTA